MNPFTDMPFPGSGATGYRMQDGALVPDVPATVATPAPAPAPMPPTPKPAAPRRKARSRKE